MKLQMRAIEVVYAYKQVEKVISTLRSLRSDSVTEFRKQFSEALKDRKTASWGHISIDISKVCETTAAPQLSFIEHT